MNAFAALFAALDQTTSTNAKVEAMARYFAAAPPDDGAWAVFFLTGRRLKRLLPWSAIGAWTLAATGLPSWLLEECWSAVGDGAETAALMLDQLGVKMTDRGNVWRDPLWMTSVPGIFTCGDMQRGQSLIVWAIAEGRSCARGVDEFLMGRSDLPAPLV